MMISTAAASTKKKLCRNVLLGWPNSRLPPLTATPNTQISQQAISNSRNVPANCRLFNACRVSLTRIGFIQSLNVSIRLAVISSVLMKSAPIMK